MDGYLSITCFSLLPLSSWGRYVAATVKEKERLLAKKSTSMNVSKKCQGLDRDVTSLGLIRVGRMRTAPRSRLLTGGRRPVRMRRRKA